MGPSDDSRLQFLRRQHERLLSRLQDGQSELRFLKTKFSKKRPACLDRDIAARKEVTFVPSKNSFSATPAGYYRSPTLEVLNTLKNASKPARVVSNDSIEPAHSPIYYHTPTTHLLLTPPNKSTASLQTPTKSIVRRRKIIDDNVKVASKYEHTPCKDITGKIGAENVSKTGTSLPPEKDALGEKEFAASFGVLPGVIERLEEKGNVRPRKHQARELTDSVEQTTYSQLSRQPANENLPLLGYDWIASNLDNDRQPTICDKPEDFFERIKHFRALNRDDCAVNQILKKPVDLSRPISPRINDPTHTCIHGYNVNERLFTEPMNTDEDGKSICPICLATQRKPTCQSPAYVRVSVPRAGLQTSDQLKPHRRRSFDPTDSCALSEHCLAGWECSRPASMKPASNIDLRHATHGIKSQLITTMNKAEMEAAGLCF